MRTTTPSWQANWFESISACLLCGSAELVPCIDGVEDWFFRAVPGCFKYDRCKNCSSLLLRERPKPENLGMAYAGYYTHSSAGVYQPATGNGTFLLEAYKRYRFERSRSIIDRLIGALYSCFPKRVLRLNLTYRFIPKRKVRVLDYGCGSGDYLRFAQDLGHDVFGIDFDPSAVAAARAQGIPAAVPAEVPLSRLEHGFHHVVANHVIEHVSDPVALLRSFHDWLVPGGTAYLEFPNGQAEGLRQYGKYWRGLEAPRHFSVPSADGIRLAARRAGFHRIEMLGQPANDGIRSSMWSQSEVAWKEDHKRRSNCSLHGDAGGNEFVSVLLHKG